jgi:hypothetical protein
MNARFLRWGADRLVGHVDTTESKGRLRFERIPDRNHHEQRDL